mgnify:FL=1
MQARLSGEGKCTDLLCILSSVSFCVPYFLWGAYVASITLIFDPTCNPFFQFLIGATSTCWFASQTSDLLCLMSAGIRTSFAFVIGCILDLTWKSAPNDFSPSLLLCFSCMSIWEIVIPEGLSLQAFRVDALDKSLQRAIFFDDDVRRIGVVSYVSGCLATALLRRHTWVNFLLLRILNVYMGLITITTLQLLIYLWHPSFVSRQDPKERDWRNVLRGAIGVIQTSPVVLPLLIQVMLGKTAGILAWLYLMGAVPSRREDLELNTGTVCGAMGALVIFFLWW